MELYEYEATKYHPHIREGFLFADLLIRSSNLKPRLAATPHGFENLRTRNVMSRLSMLDKAC